jgi:hypothetical protein
MPSGSEHHNPTTPDNSEGAKREPKHWLEYAIFFFVIATAVATGFAAWYTRQQWLTAVDTEQRQTRAYVALQDIRLERLDGATFEVIPEWENTGNSQTVHMESHLNRFMSDAAVPGDFAFADLPATSVPILLSPKSTSTVTFDKIPASCLTQFNRRDEFTTFYIWGWAKYNDTLSSSPHITRFCWDANQVVFSTEAMPKDYRFRPVPSARWYNSIPDGMCRP